MRLPTAPGDSMSAGSNNYPRPLLQPLMCPVPLPVIHRLLLAALLTTAGCSAEAPPLDAQPEAPSTPEPKTAPKAPPVAEAPAEPVVDAPADPAVLAPGPESDAPPVASEKPKDKQPIVARAHKPAPKAKPEPAPAPKSTAETANAKPPKVPDSGSAKPVTPAPARPFDEAYATLLAKHVKNGRVDYGLAERTSILMRSGSRHYRARPTPVGLRVESWSFGSTRTMR
jgi:outer membrane biosynthesis protein TonB